MNELIDLAEPAWPMVLGWIESTKNQVTLLPAARSAGESTLLALQVTTRSPMGAIALEAGALFFDHGWLRLLDAGCDRLRESLSTWNGLDGTTERPEGFLVVAHDAVGGFFVLNGGALSARSGHVVYAAPDTLDWFDLQLGYTDFVQWAASGDLARFYADLRWPDWEADVAPLTGDQGITFAPPLFTREAQAARPERRSRAVVPMRELWGLWHDFRTQLRGT